MKLLRLSLALCGAHVALGFSSSYAAAKQQLEARQNNSSEPVDPIYQLSKDEQFHFEALRVLAFAVYEGSDISETLAAINKIKPGDLESFGQVFDDLANRVWNRSQAINATKYPISARNAYFHASSYFRSADFFLHGNPADPRIYSLWGQQILAFDSALALLPTPGERVTLQGDGFDIPAIFYGSGLPDPRPTIILCNGYDGSQEELYHVMVKAIIERGMNAITYEGPGQPLVRREQNMGFIPEWEKVVTPVVDYALTRPEVDPCAIGSMGYSFGGLLVPRAAAFEHRLAAVIALDGVFDFGAVVHNALSPELLDLYNSGNAEAVDAAVKELLADPHTPTATRWAIEQGTWSFNTTSPYEWVKQTEAYTLDKVVDKIRTPVFVGDAQNDMFFAGQPKILVDRLGDLATHHKFTNAEGAGEHCSVGAAVQQNQVVLDWFQDLIEKKKA
ncbi:Fc.00g079840.m01.CDS01 [Cosmosporella sp. VM-42]